MNWYYVDNGQQAGPVTDEQMAELRRSGKVQDTTLVWREGMPDWKPWVEAPSTGAPPVAPGGVVCAECGNTFKPDEVIRVNERFVCAACKPVYLQRIREGLIGSGAASPTGTATLEQVLARDYEHDLGGYLSRGWETFKSDPGLIIGASVLVYLSLIAVNVIPYLSYILAIVFTGPLMGGAWVFYLKKLRREAASVGDAFSGFGPRFGQLLLGNFIPTLLAGVCFIPAAIVVVIAVITFAAPHRSGAALDSGVVVTLVSLGAVFGVAGLCGYAYLATCWLFALPLIADKGMDFWPAMSLSRQVVIKHWWMTFLVMLVIGLVSSLGFLALCIGLLVTGPTAFAAMASAYEKLFGDLAPGQG